METTKDQIVARKQQLLGIVDDLFAVFEEVHRLLSNWTSAYHTLFIEQCIQLQHLEVELSALGYDEDFVLTVKQAVYRSVFGG